MEIAHTSARPLVPLLLSWLLLVTGCGNPGGAPTLARTELQTGIRALFQAGDEALVVDPEGVLRRLEGSPPTPGPSLGEVPDLGESPQLVRHPEQGWLLTWSDGPLVHLTPERVTLRTPAAAVYQLLEGGEAYLEGETLRPVDPERGWTIPRVMAAAGRPGRVVVLDLDGNLEGVDPVRGSRRRLTHLDTPEVVEFLLLPTPEVVVTAWRSQRSYPEGHYQSELTVEGFRDRTRLFSYLILEDPDRATLLAGLAADSRGLLAIRGEPVLEGEGEGTRTLVNDLPYDGQGASGMIPLPDPARFTPRLLTMRGTRLWLEGDGELLQLHRQPLQLLGRAPLGDSPLEAWADHPQGFLVLQGGSLSLLRGRPPPPP